MQIFPITDFLQYFIIGLPFLTMKMDPSVFPAEIEKYVDAPDTRYGKTSYAWKNDLQVAQVLKVSTDAQNTNTYYLNSERRVLVKTLSKENSDSIDFTEAYSYSGSLLVKWQGQYESGDISYKNGNIDSVCIVNIHPDDKSEYYYKFTYDPDARLLEAKRVILGAPSDPVEETKYVFKNYFPDSVQVKRYAVGGSGDTSNSTVIMKDGRPDLIVAPIWINQVKHPKIQHFIYVNALPILARKNPIRKARENSKRFDILGKRIGYESHRPESNAIDR